LPRQSKLLQGLRIKPRDDAFRFWGERSFCNGIQVILIYAAHPLLIFRPMMREEILRADVRFSLIWIRFTAQ
jgi:hypothetical protein